jgi:rod shape determining protein RodA
LLYTRSSPANSPDMHSFRQSAVPDAKANVKTPKVDKMYFVEKTKEINYLKQFDYPLFVAVLLLSFIGILVLRSAIGVPRVTGMWLKQAICLAIGVVIAVFISMIDYKDFKILGIMLYIASVIMLVLVLVPGIGVKHGGSQSWLQVPIAGFEFQPSELAKVAFAVVVPVFLERLKEGKEIGKNVVKLLFYSMLPIILILLQPDIGTALVFIFAFVVMLFIYGIPYRYFLVSFGVLAVSVPLLWIFVIPQNSYIRNRIITFLNPETDLSGAGLQVYRSKMAIGSGQIFGKGLFHGLRVQDGSTVSSSIYVPKKVNDFIFSVIGEELGFVGSVIVIAIIFFILMRGIYIAMNARDDYGSFMVVCIISMLGFHFIENIGMSIGVMPVTGIPLPFVSQGNSSLLANFLNVGILLSVSMRRKKTIFNASQ